MAGQLGDRLLGRDDVLAVSSTSEMRSAQTVDRGTCISRKVPIITDIRICIR